MYDIWISPSSFLLKDGHTGFSSVIHWFSEGHGVVYLSCTSPVPFVPRYSRPKASCACYYLYFFEGLVVRVARKLCSFPSGVFAQTDRGPFHVHRGTHLTPWAFSVDLFCIWVCGWTF